MVRVMHHRAYSSIAGGIPDSGWMLRHILNLILNVNKYNPLHAGYHIELLREIKIKKAVINVHGQCVLRVINGCRSTPARNHTNRESSYQHYNTVLNLQGIQFPMRLNQIIKFENQNNISINVYSIEEQKKFFPYSIDAPAERGTSMLICCTYRIHRTITKGILR